MKCCVPWCEQGSDPNGGSFCRGHVKSLTVLRKTSDAYLAADQNGDVESLDELEPATVAVITAALDVVKERPSWVREK